MIRVARLAALLLVCLLPAGVASAGTTEMISLNYLGDYANGHSGHISVSAEGRFVAFSSTASDLVEGDTNGREDVFVFDRQTDQMALVSVASDGTQGDYGSSHPAISADGRYVAFESLADNLVSGDTNFWSESEEWGPVLHGSDIFVRDRATGTTTRVSVASDGTEGSDCDSFAPSMSADGRYVAFYSSAANLVSGDTNGLEDVFVHDCATGQTSRVSLATDGAEPNSWCTHPAISADGRYVAFTSPSSNLVPDDTNGAMDVFVRDLAAGTTERVSVAADGAEGNSFCDQHIEISADGRFVVFASWASNLLAADPDADSDIYLRDRLLGTTELVSVSSSGEKAMHLCSWPSMSGDGRFIAFASPAHNLAPGGDPAYDLWRIFLRDHTTSQTVEASVGSPDILTSGNPCLSANGEVVAFVSMEYDSGLGLGTPNNAAWDVFVRVPEVAGFGTIEGIVTDAVTLSPLAGAAVWAEGFLWAQSDAAGVYRFPSVPTGTYEVAVEVEGYEPAAQMVDVAAGQTTAADFALLAEGLVRGAMEGHVTDAATSAAIAGATVSAGSETTTTAADGYYLLSDLAPGSYSVTAAAEHHQSVTQTDVVVAPGGTTVVDLELVPSPGSISGTVTDDATGAPVPGASVRCGSVIDGTGVGGDYLLVGVPPGSGLAITVSAPRYSSATVEDVTVAAEQTTTVDVALQLIEAFGFPVCTASPATQWMVGASGTRAVWADDRNGTFDIYLYDAAAETERAICTAAGDQLWPEIDGDRIVWMDHRGSEWQVYLYDLAAQHEQLISDAPAADIWRTQGPDISGDLIVWSDTRNGNLDVFAYDLGTATRTQLTDDAADQGEQGPRVHGDRVVWRDCRNGTDGDIYAYEVSTHEETLVAGGEVDQAQPDVWGDTVVWRQAGALGFDIWCRESDAGPRPLSQEAAAEDHPRVNAQWAVWSAHESDGATVLWESVQAYDFHWGYQRPLSTSQFCGNLGPALADSGLVAWVDYRDGDRATGTNPDIYGALLTSFTDVLATDWSYSYVEACVEAGIVGGYWDGTYKPTSEVDRAAMAVFVARGLTGGDTLVPEPAAGAEPRFSDVAADHWAYRYVEYCAGAGIVQGYPGGTYHPSEVVSRGQMAVYVARAAANPPGDASVPEVPAGTPATFTDVTADGDSAWCHKYVEFIADLGVVQGYWDGSYRPGDTVTRGQMAVYIARAFGLAV